MNCQEAEMLMSQSLDGELDSPSSESSLQQHLESCPACRSRSEAWRDFGQFMREDEIPVPPPVETAWQEIRREIQAGEPPGVEEIREETASSWFWSTPAAIAALLVLSLGLYFVLPIGVNNTPAYTESTKIEFLETDIPGASTMVFADQESGLTVLWVVESTEG